MSGHSFYFILLCIETHTETRCGGSGLWPRTLEAEAGGLGVPEQGDLYSGSSQTATLPKTTVAIGGGERGGVGELGGEGGSVECEEDKRV